MILLYGCILVVIYVVFIVAPALVVSRAVFCRKQGTPYVERDLSGTYLRDHVDLIKRDFDYFAGLTPEWVSITAWDGETLPGELYSVGEGKLAVCVHGYNTTPMNCFATLGRILMEQGYDVLMIHQRGHGNSGGKACTMGLLEQKDVVDWAKWACARENIQEVILVGVSMGCASVGYASDKITDPKVKAMILDCGFVSPANQIRADSRKRHLPDKLLMPWIRFFVRKMHHVDINETVWSSLQNTKIPALFVHGGADTTVNVQETEINYEHCASYREKYILPEAGHACTFMAGGEEGKERLENFLIRAREKREEQ